MMYNDSGAEIVQNKKGYYTLLIDGIFAGNYDTANEAANAYDQLLCDENE